MKLAIFVFLASSSVIRAKDENPLRLPLPTEVANNNPELLSEPINSPFARIVGGVLVGSGEAKHQIALFSDGTFICGGSLISSQTVLTAAHCVYGNVNKPSTFSVRYDTLNRNNGPTLSVKKINQHALYNPTTIDYDVATLTLSSPFTPGTNAAMISLTTSEPEPDSILTVTGWGRLSNGGSLPSTLQRADTLRTLDRKDCQERWGTVNSITDRMICAISEEQSACNGDSGGPVTLNGVLVGVVSWGSNSCLHAKYPNVYANVANLRTWIMKNSS